MAGSRGDTIPLSGPFFSKGSGRQSLPVPRPERKAPHQESPRRRPVPQGLR